jgi:hypothetical protein
MKPVHFLLGLILFAAPCALAQTNAPDATANTDATNAPSDATAPASTSLAPSNALNDATAPSLAVPPSTSTNADTIPGAAAPLSVTPTANGPAPASGPDPSIEDIRPPFFFLHSWFWLWIALAVIAVIALIVFLIFRFMPNRQLTPKSAYELALEKLEQARALLNEENPVPYAVFISETIRSYLGQRFQSPSTRRTTEEFLRIMDADPYSPLATHRELLRDFLRTCDLVKFARYQPALNELEQVQQRAYTFVTATKPETTPVAATGKLVAT